MDIIEFLVNGVVIMILIHVGLNLMTRMVKRRADSDLDKVSNDLELETNDEPNNTNTNKLK